MASPVIVSGGEISYAVYLFHVTLIGIVIAWVRPETPALWLASLLVALAVIVLVSAGGHHLIERPAQRALRRGFSRKSARADETVG